MSVGQMTSSPGLELTTKVKKTAAENLPSALRCLSKSTPLASAVSSEGPVPKHTRTAGLPAVPSPCGKGQRPEGVRAPHAVVAILSPRRRTQAAEVKLRTNDRMCSCRRPALGQAHACDMPAPRMKAHLPFF